MEICRRVKVLCTLLSKSESMSFGVERVRDSEECAAPLLGEVSGMSLKEGRGRLLGVNFRKK